MPTFEYKATDPEGQAVQGTLAGTSLTTAAGELEKRGLVVEHLAAVEGVPEPIAGPPPKIEGERPDISSERNYVQTHVVGQAIGKVPLSDQLFLFRQLATMLKAGVGMVQSLETLSRQTQNYKLVAILREATEHAREGRPLSFCFQRYPEVFAPLVLSMVRVGEESGTLDSTLRYIAEYLEREIRLRNMIRRQTLYPKIVIGASILIIGGANLVVGFFGGTGIYSPLTQWSTWVVLGPIIVGIYLFVRFGLPNPNVRHSWDGFVQGIPYIGATSRMFAMAKFGRALAAMYRGGVPLHRGTMLAADACGNDYIRAKFAPAGHYLEEGRSISETMALTGAVDPIVLDMIRTGDATGNLDMMLDKMADFYEDDGETRSNVMATVLGVVCLLIVAIYVLYVVVTFYTGHFSNLGSAGE